jgi:hypothetical protein
MVQEVYVMRLWYGSLQDSSSWRVTVTDTRNQEKFHFADLDKLVGFFKERLETNVQKPPNDQQKPHP